ncbi:immunoglobulin alpha Fc receptor isoform c precursor, partial [Daubentonia madagascariensis]
CSVWARGSRRRK